jgi:hypothetical protein
MVVKLYYPRKLDEEVDGVGENGGVDGKDAVNQSCLMEKV